MPFKSAKQQKYIEGQAAAGKGWAKKYVKDAALAHSKHKKKKLKRRS